MKIRNGFVSNSSSSSFIIIGQGFDTAGDITEREYTTIPFEYEYSKQRLKNTLINRQDDDEFIFIGINYSDLDCGQDGYDIIELNQEMIQYTINNFDRLNKHYTIIKNPYRMSTQNMDMDFEIPHAPLTNERHMKMPHGDNISICAIERNDHSYDTLNEYALYYFAELK